ncbi:hypothetical protein MTP99_019591 [Tenebrio molitor]|nr:hypothetical protein MTP99_019591 [Tenebrio molitor]
MSKVICILVFLVLVFNSCASIENNLDKTGEILLKLTNYAIEGRQIRNPCHHETNTIRYFQCVKKLNSYAQIQRPHLAQNFAQIHRPYPVQNVPQYRPPQTQQNIMDVLYTIAKNDALRCVPRLLCEATSDTLSQSRGFTLPSLPFNIDMESIIRLLATIDIPGGSPIPIFARAALLGYVSKGKSDSCVEAYPSCPRDPDKLVLYLNNYNGGFFRYFDGLGQRFGPINQQQGLGNDVAQERIQNRPAQHLPNAFPESNDAFVFSSNEIDLNRSPKTLFAFPTRDESRFDGFAQKKPKELAFPVNEYYSNELDLQRPLPNHKASPVIFPSRTGTGDLRLDAEELSDHDNRQNNHFVSFKPEPNEGFYYEVPSSYSPTRTLFNFPV